MVLGSVTWVDINQNRALRATDAAVQDFYKISLFYNYIDSKNLQQWFKVMSDLEK